MPTFRVRGAQAGSTRFEFDLEGDDPWHVIARAYRRIDEPSTVTSISVMPVGSAAR